MNAQPIFAVPVLSLGKRAVLAAAVAGALLIVADHDAEAQVSNYPACDTPSNPLCAMSDIGNQQVLPGTIGFVPDNPYNYSGNAISIYPIFYGAFADSHGNRTAYETSLINELVSLINALSDSSYSAITRTYSGPNGTAAARFLIRTDLLQDASYHVGKTPAATDFQSELGYLTGVAGGPPVDPNGLYVFVTDKDVAFTAQSSNGTLTYCVPDSNMTTACGYNNVAQVGSSTLHYVVVGSNETCTNCAWGFPTPHNVGGTDTIGRLDKALSTLAHELNEAITDPFADKGGWYSSTTSNSTTDNTQMADFCASATHGLNQHNINSGPAFNFHGNGDDFLLQPLRVNASSNGSVGYCVTGYGEPFQRLASGYSWNPTGSDWNPQSYKAECEPGQVLVGMSQSVNNLGVPGRAHSIMCATVTPATYPQSSACVAHTWSAPSTGTFVCGPNQFAAGFSTDSIFGGVDGMLCCPLAGSQGTCSTFPFDGNSVASSDTQWDWDWGFGKAECAEGQFVQGVTTGFSGGQLIPLSITCCTHH